MQLPLFEQHYFLPALGWAVINSFWQGGCLWIIYKLITTTDKKLPALARYHLSLLFLFSSFTWFLATLFQNYRLLSDQPANSNFLSNEYLIGQIQLLNKALPLFGSVYLILMVFYLAGFIRELAAGIFLQRNGLGKAPLDIRLFVDQTANQIGISKKIKVWMSASIEVPSVTGILKPIILLPLAIVNHLSQKQIEAILLHEMAHIRRNDLFVNLLQSIVMVVLFFNPFAILLHRTVKKERENCCDDWVLNFRFDQHDYARALLILEEHRQQQQPLFALAATNGKKVLLQRIKRLFNANTRVEFNGSQKLRIAGLCGLLLFSIACFLPAIRTINPRDITVKSLPQQDEIMVFPSYQAVNNDNDLKKVIMAKPIVADRPQVRKRKPAPVQQEIINAFINEDLLMTETAPGPSVIAVAEKETGALTYFIKVEEEQSGEKQQNTYLLELSNKEGNPEVKPLIIINKIVGTAPAVPTRPLTGDSSRPAKKMISKKRVTS